MEQAEIIQRVNLALSENFEIPADKLRGEATLFQDLGLDSLDAIDMVVYLEESLGIRVKGEDFKDMRTLSDVYKLVGDLSVASDAAPKGNA